MTIRKNTILTIKRGAWIAHIIDRNLAPQNHMVADSLRYMVRLDDPNGYNTQWPIQYDNGDIAYDYSPMPRDALRATEACYRHITQLRTLVVQ